MCHVTSATPALRKGKETSSEGPSAAVETAPAGPSKQIHLPKSIERPKGMANLGLLMLEVVCCSDGVKNAALGSCVGGSIMFTETVHFWPDSGYS